MKERIIMALLRFKRRFFKPTKKDVLRYALCEFIIRSKCDDAFFWRGLCRCVCYAIDALDASRRFYNERDVLSLPSCKVWHEYWWPKFDNKSRIKYMKKLIAKEK